MIRKSANTKSAAGVFRYDQNRNGGLGVSEHWVSTTEPRHYRLRRVHGGEWDSHLIDGVICSRCETRGKGDEPIQD